jgi:HicA toxin of bacterial toxin-antitoxin,
MVGSAASRAAEGLYVFRGLGEGFITLGQGKGSHGRLYYGNRFTTLKDRRKEIGPGLLNAMLAQLGLTKADLED